MVRTLFACILPPWHVCNLFAIVIDERRRLWDESGMAKDEILARLKAANHEGGQIISRTPSGTFSRWEPRQALDAVIEELAVVLAEMDARVAK